MSGKPNLPKPFAVWTTGPRGGFMAERESRKGWYPAHPLYSEEQMKQYADDAVKEANTVMRERCAVVLDRLKNKESERYGVGLVTTRAEITIRAFISGAEEIRNLGAAL